MDGNGALAVLFVLFLLWQVCVKLDRAVFELRKIKELLGIIAKKERGITK